MGNYFRKTISIALIAAFVWSSLYLPQAQAQMVLPPVGVRVNLSPAFTPAIIRGMTIDVKNPFAFSFLVDQGDKPLPQSEKKDVYQKMIKYFLAAMTIAEDKQWVNLSPYEGNRIIDADFGKTEMGRDLLAQDYMLKQITASLIYPEEAVGKEFWQKVYQEAAEKYGTTQIPINTFNKVWIMPETADVYEKDNTVLIVDSKLKVMLEEDYLAVEKNHQNQALPVSASVVKQSQDPKGIAKKVLLEVVIPALTKEVNEGKNFANLRQIYHGMVLATWYKQALKSSILTQIYVNKDKIKGVDLANPVQAQQEVYQRYLKAFKKGVYNFIKEEQDPATGQMVPKKYFSGGYTSAAMKVTEVNAAMAAGKWGKVKRVLLEIVTALVTPTEVGAGESSATTVGPTVEAAVNPTARANDMQPKRIKEMPQVPPMNETQKTARRSALILGGSANWDADKHQADGISAGSFQDFEGYLQRRKAAGGQSYGRNERDEYIALFLDRLKPDAQYSEISFWRSDLEKRDISKWSGERVARFLLTANRGTRNGFRSLIYHHENLGERRLTNFQSDGMRIEELLGLTDEDLKTIYFLGELTIERIKIILGVYGWYLWNDQKWQGRDIADFLTIHEADFNALPGAYDLLMQVLPSNGIERVKDLLAKGRDGLLEVLSDRNDRESIITLVEEILDQHKLGWAVPAVASASSGEPAATETEAALSFAMESFFAYNSFHKGTRPLRGIARALELQGPQGFSDYSAKQLRQLGLSPITIIRLRRTLERGEHGSLKPDGQETEETEIRVSALSKVKNARPKAVRAGAKSPQQRSEREGDVVGELTWEEATDFTVAQFFLGVDFRKVPFTPSLRQKVTNSLRGKGLKGLRIIKQNLQSLWNMPLWKFVEWDRSRYIRGVGPASWYVMEANFAEYGKDHGLNLGMPLDTFFDNPDAQNRLIAVISRRISEDKVALAQTDITPGGIDMNAANLNLQIKRDGRGVPLPLAQQDMAQLSSIQGFSPVIIEIRPAATLPIFSELQTSRPALASAS